jgi:Ser/Thr protein kinase RdoA (MazF antagonist)
MRLSTMWKVDRATTPDGRNPIAEELAEYWEHEPRSVRFFRSSANFVYTIVAGDRHFLRFADTRERSRPAIEAELELLKSLARNGLGVAAPVPSRRGNIVETVTTSSGTYHACVFPALPGTELELARLGLPQRSEVGERPSGACMPSSIGWRPCRTQGGQRGAIDCFLSPPT